MHPPLWLWIAFNLGVAVVLALDLGVFHRRAHSVSLREAATWTMVWVLLSAAFAGYLQHVYGGGPALSFVTGYLIEYALSVDNIFVFVLLFSYFRVPEKHQHRILFWGILGALVMRGTLIVAGTALLHRFHWIQYLFGAFLLYAAVRMAKQEDERIDPQSNRVLRFVRMILPITTEPHEGRFFVRERTTARRSPFLAATPLFVVLVLVETTDLLFALDSIPAVFSVTSDPFLVYTSNICAILGLRSLYFLLVDVIDRFHYLPLGLAGVLGFVGLKMLASGVVGVSIPVSLAVILTILIVAASASVLWPKPRNAPQRTGVGSHERP